MKCPFKKERFDEDNNLTEFAEEYCPASCCGECIVYATFKENETLRHELEIFTTSYGKVNDK